MRIDLPDDLADRLQADAPKRPLSRIVQDRLKLVEGISLQDRTLILTGKDLRALEELLGKGSLLTAQDLLQYLSARLAMQIDGFDLPFTFAEKQEMTLRARRNGRTIDQEIRDQLHLFHDLLFNGAPSVRV